MCCRESTSVCVGAGARACTVRTVRMHTEHLCWAAPTHDITVGTQDIDGISFRQTGYRASVESTVDNLKIVGTLGASASVQLFFATQDWVYTERNVVRGTEMLKKGTNYVCLPAAGA